MKTLTIGTKVKMSVSGQKVSGVIERIIDTGCGYKYDVAFSKMVFATGGPYIGCITTSEQFIK